MHIDNYVQLKYGHITQVASSVLRVLAANPKPLTFRGTNSYVIGDDVVAILDPGPDMDAHVNAVMEAVNGRKVASILVTHSHVDHSGAAHRLSALTGAEVLGYGALPDLIPSNCVEQDYHLDFAPHRCLEDGEEVQFGNHIIEAIHTPGHFPNHLCYALKGTDVLFSGDHVLGWASTVVAPPIGKMCAYIQSLEKLNERVETVFLPGHGPVISKPKDVLKKLIDHRFERENQVLACLSAGMTEIEDIVRKLYTEIDEGLFVPACKSVEAHIHHLKKRGLLNDSSYETALRIASA